jgi:hypothetical protein
MSVEIRSNREVLWDRYVRHFETVLAVHPGMLKAISLKQLKQGLPVNRQAKQSPFIFSEGSSFSFLLLGLGGIDGSICGCVWFGFRV